MFYSFSVEMTISVSHGAVLQISRYLLWKSSKFLSFVQIYLDCFIQYLSKGKIVFEKGVFKTKTLDENVRWIFDARVSLKK